MAPGPRQAIIWLARLFTMICKKVVNVVELERNGSASDICCGAC